MTSDLPVADRMYLLIRVPILKEDFTIGGPVMADLHSSISTTDADFVVKVIDVFPDTLSYQRIDIYAVNEAEKNLSHGWIPNAGERRNIPGEIPE